MDESTRRARALALGSFQAHNATAHHHPLPFSIVPLALEFRDGRAEGPPFQEIESVIVDVRFGAISDYAAGGGAVAVFGEVTGRQLNECFRTDRQLCNGYQTLGRPASGRIVEIIRRHLRLSRRVLGMRFADLRDSHRKFAQTLPADPLASPCRECRAEPRGTTTRPANADCTCSGRSRYDSTSPAASSSIAPISADHSVASTNCWTNLQANSERLF